MGIRHFSLDLPAHLPATDAEETARTELRRCRETGWTRLHLHPLSPTTQAGISTYLFAYWIPNDDHSGSTAAASRDPRPTRAGRGMGPIW